MTGRRLPKPFAPAEMHALMVAAKPRPELAAIVVFLAETGLRSAETCSITSPEVRGWPTPPWYCRRRGCRRHATTYRVIGKGDKERMIPVSAEAIRAAKTLTAFSRNGHMVPWSDRGLRYVIAELGKRAGVENAHPHRFRHTFATELVNAGLPIETVADLMGHSRVDITRLYFLTSSVRAIDALRVRRRTLRRVHA